MITYVKGTLAFVTEQAATVDVGGVGYLVNVSSATLGRLPSLNSPVQLFTYLQTSESGQSLHGFLTQEELRMFTLLISVSGIGPKVGAAILGTLSPQDIIMAVIAEDVTALGKAPGVGKKTAERLLLELRDKIKTSDAWEKAGGMAASAAPMQKGEKQDAMDALLALGYGRTEAMQALLEVAEDGMTADMLIRLTLKKLAR